VSERGEPVAEPTETDAAAEPIEGRIRPLRVLGGLVFALFAAAALVVGIGRAAGFSKLTNTLDHADTRWLVVCALGQLVVFAGYTGAFRHAVAFEDGPQISTSLSLRVVLASFALSQLVAAGGAAGLAVTYWALRRIGLPRRDAAVRLIGLATLIYLVFGVLGWGAAGLTLLLAAAPLGLTLPWIIGVPIVLFAARWFTEEGRVSRWAAPEGGILRRGLATGVAAAWWVRRAVTGPDAPTILAWAACYWLGDIASLWGGLHAFGGHPGIVPLTLVYATGYLAQSIPIPFVATGGMDAATTFALTLIGVPLEVALLGVIAHRIFAFWIPLVPGLVLVGFLPRTGQALEAAGASADPASNTPGPAGQHLRHA
jgi:uncharacterized membrane protein YbhN (UPF0104 family)